MSETRVFLSFDIDHDVDLSDLVSEQSRQGGSGFLVSAQSRAGEVTDRWSEVARRDIRDADQVIVICGEHTRDCVRVNTELGIALEEEKPYFLLWGRRDRDCTMPERVQRTGCMYSWSPEILQQQIWAQQKKGLLDVAHQYRRPKDN